MVFRDPNCVFITDDPSVADVIVSSLGHHGIEAQVMNRATLGGLIGLTPLSTTGVSADGIEVWVKNSDDVHRAKELLAEFEEAKAQKQAKLEQLGPIDAVCEECGQTSMFPGEQRGTIQDCPQCGAYIDVPGTEDEYDWTEADASATEDPTDD